MKLCIKKRTKITIIRYDLDKLRNPVISKEYSDKFKNEILQIKIDEIDNNTLFNIEKSIH